MNMLPVKLPPVEDEALVRITRLVRRVCVLREQGETAEAKRLEDEKLGSEIRDLRLSQGPQALPEGELAALFATESKRAIEAVALAEMLIPQLLGRLPANPVPAPAPVRPFVPTSVPAPELRPATMGGSPAIPDLLDAMLARERTALRRT